MTPQQVARAVRMYRSGRTLREIEARLGVDNRAVWAAIRGQVETRRRGPRGRTDVTDAQIVELRNDLELSWAQIAAQVGMSRTGVRARYLVATGRRRWR